MEAQDEVGARSDDMRNNVYGDHQSAVSAVFSKLRLTKNFLKARRCICFCWQISYEFWSLHETVSVSFTRINESVTSLQVSSMCVQK